MTSDVEQFWEGFMRELGPTVSMWVEPDARALVVEVSLGRARVLQVRHYIGLEEFETMYAPALGASLAQTILGKLAEGVKKKGGVD